jgi:hypothetical protein
MREESRYKEGLSRLLTRLGFDSQNCPVCHANGRSGTMTFRYSIVQQEPVADNIILKCRTCKHLAGFGIPMSSADLEKEIELREGTWFTPHWKSGSDPDEIILKRLEELGYIEYEYRRMEGAE